MRRRPVRLIAAKELLDTLRDRRTLFVALLLPLLLYPALLLGLTQVIGMTQRNLAAERQTVLVAGDARALAALVTRLEEQQLETRPAEGDAAELAARLRGDVAAWREEPSDALLGRLREAMDARGVEAVLLAPDDFGERIAQERPADLTLLYDPTDEPSRAAHGKVRRALDAYEAARRDELRERHPDQEQRLRFAEAPVRREVVQVATSSQKGAYSFAPMLGMLIVIMALTGAFYPAVDLAAGEKERGTMETLLVAPVTRTQIVLGKFLAIWLIAVVTALLNLVVMGVTFSKLARMISGTGAIAFSLPLSTMAAVATILVPTAALFAAVSLALSSFATSYKEGQHYLSPVFLVAMPLAMVGLLPNVEIGYGLALVPIANVVLLVKAMLLGGEAVGPGLVATLTVGVYAAGALAVAVSVFRRESVLFRGGAGRSHDAASLAASREGVPREGLAVALFFVVLAAMFFLSDSVETRADAYRALLLAQAAVLVPTLVFARRARLDFGRTFRLRPLRLAYVPVVIAAACCTLVLVSGAYRWMPAREQAEGIAKVYELLAGIPGWQLFVLLAVLPPLCEELLCRGFLLSAFRARRGALAAVVASAALFGALHLDVYRFPGTFAAGLVLGWLCVRTGSILAPMLFHLVYNGLIALSGQLPAVGGMMAAAGPAEMGLAAIGLGGVIVVLGQQARRRAAHDAGPV